MRLDSKASGRSVQAASSINIIKLNIISYHIAPRFETKACGKLAIGLRRTEWVSSNITYPRGFGELLKESC